VRKLRKVAVLGLTTAVAALGLAACGGGGGGGGGGTEGGTAKVLMGTAPDYLDPQEEYTTQGAEATWISYTPLVTYKHENAPTGNDVIPGLATSLPQISSDGKTYTLTLRKGLVFSDGTPIKASDFACTAERMIKVNWGGKSFFTDNVSGATAFDKGQADSISGITTDDNTGKITIQLDKPYGAFTNVLGFPELGLVPCGTPEHTLTTDLPPSSGPYMVTDIVPNKSFSVVKNPKWAALNVPDIPVGHLDRIDVTIQSNTQTEAQQVLNSQADNFDAGDTLPPSIVPQVRSQASDRFEAVTIPSTFYFFLNVNLPPFNNELARQAVNVAIDRPALQRLASGFLKPECFLHPGGPRRPPGWPLPVRRRPGSWRHRQGAAAGPAVGNGGADDHRLGRAARASDPVRRVLRRSPQQDRLQGHSEADLGHDLLPDDRQREDRAADGIRRLDSGLPEPGRLLSPVDDEFHSARQQRELRQRQRSVHRPAGHEARAHTDGEAGLGGQPVAGGG